MGWCCVQVSLITIGPHVPLTGRLSQAQRDPGGEAAAQDPHAAGDGDAGQVGGGVGESGA